MHPLELNQVVGGFRTMLRHSLGENVRLDYRLTEEPCVVEGDRGQIEQTILNLALRVLFMSGYAADVLGDQDDPRNFLQKPFSLPTFAAKLGEALGTNPGSE